MCPHKSTVRMVLHVKSDLRARSGAEHECCALMHCSTQLPLLDSIQEGCRVYVQAVNTDNIAMWMCPLINAAHHHCLAAWVFNSFKRYLILCWNQCRSRADLERKACRGEEQEHIYHFGNVICIGRVRGTHEHAGTVFTTISDNCSCICRLLTCIEEARREEEQDHHHQRQGAADQGGYRAHGAGRREIQGRGRGGAA